jgi:hypothetical protein
LIDAALQLGYHITFEANGDELRKKYNYTFETIVYDRAVVLQRLKENGLNHSWMRIEDRPGNGVEWSMNTDWSRYNQFKPHLSFKGSDPQDFLECLTKVSDFVVSDEQ